MKKKFDFTAEMKEAQITKSTPQNEYLEEEKRLLGINVKELAELNDNVYGLRTDLTALVDLLGKYKLAITQDTQEQAVKFGNTVLGQFIDKIMGRITKRFFKDDGQNDESCLFIGSYGRRSERGK